MEDLLSINCLDLWKAEEETPKLITLCKALDGQLGGGIRMRKITEFCGGSGSGKTQMCLQLCVSVQFPKEVGGVGGKAFYIDTNQDFHPERLKQIAEHMEHRFQKCFPQFCAQASTRHAFNCATIVKNISYVYCADFKELLATVIQLGKLQDPLLHLVIIDSFSFTLRKIDDVSLRTSIDYELLTQLQRLTVDCQLAVVITNELTTRFKADNNVEIVPCLGETHSHKINERILFSKDGGDHYVNVGKHMQLLKSTVPITIKAGGIRINP